VKPPRHQRERRYRYRDSQGDWWTGMVVGGMVIAALGAIVYLVEYWLSR